MKRIDFVVECPECKTALHIPLNVEEDKHIFDGSNFDATCARCYSDFKVKVQISTHLMVSSRLKN